MVPTIRPATVADIHEISRVDVETWRSAYSGVLPDEFLVGLSERQRALSWARLIARRPGDTILAEEAGAVLGFGSCGPLRDSELPYEGEVFTLYVAPDHQGRNLGRQLLLALFVRLIRCGLHSAVIWVLRQNPARFFYERVGGSAVATRRLVIGRGTGVDAVAYGWPDLPEAVQNRARARSRID